MPNLSFTDLVDIASTTGTPRITKVKNIKNRPEYSPAFDFYLPFRKHVIDIHKHSYERAQISQIIGELGDQKKVNNYPGLVDGYKRWWGKKQLVWFDPPNATYTMHEVVVRINPELGLYVNGNKFIIKLYLKSDQLSKSKVDMLLYLMTMSLSGLSEPSTQMGILDVRQGKLYSSISENPYLQAAIEAEMAYIASIWPRL